MGRSCLVGLVLILLAVAGARSGHAITWITNEVTSPEKKGFIGKAEMILEAPLGRIMKHLTDYNHLDRLNPSVKKSILLSKKGAKKTRVRLHLKTCMMFYCMNKWVVEQFKVGKREIIATVEPENNKFTYGKMHWKLEAISPNRTRLNFRSHIRPDFWIPPLLGSFIIREKLYSEMRDTFKALEKLAAE